MELNFPHTDFKPEHMPRLLTAIRDAVGRTDFDSTWTRVPDNKSFQHALGVVPRIIHVQQSDNPDGTDWTTDTWTNVSTSAITITGSKKYCRVLLEK